MADLSGIIPALPGGGTYSQRQQYGPNGSTNPNYFEGEFTQAMADAANADVTSQFKNQANFKAYDYLKNHPLYKGGGFLYGYDNPAVPSQSGGIGTPENPGTAASTQTYYSNNLTPFVAGGKIIPSQYTMTADQSVGKAQFQMNGQTATAGGPSTLQTSSPFTQTAANPAQQAPDPSANQPFLFGYNGDKGSLGGTFGSTTAGQSSPFYQSQTTPFANGSPQNLGIASPLTPQQQALIQSR